MSYKAALSRAHTRLLARIHVRAVATQAALLRLAGEER